MNTHAHVVPHGTELANLRVSLHQWLSTLSLMDLSYSDSDFEEEAGGRRRGSSSSSLRSAINRARRYIPKARH